MELRCVICGGFNDSLKNKQGLTGEEFRKGFSLFCKLLINSDGDSGRSKNAQVKVKEKGGGGGNEDDLLSLIAGEDNVNDTPPPNCCKSCSKALEEVVRLERVIQDIKVSQLVHVNTLKEAVISSKPAEISNDGHDDDDPQNSFWKQVTNQLISKCFPNPSSVSQVKRNERRSRRAKRPKVEITPTQPPSTSGQSSQLPLNTSHLSRHSKVKAYQNLRKLSNQPDSVEDQDQQSRSPPSADLDNNNDDPPDDHDSMTSIKEEPQDVDHDDDNQDHPNDFEDHLTDSPGNEEYAAVEDNSSESEDDPGPQRSRRSKPKSSPSPNQSQTHLHTVHLLSESENLYIFKNTFIKYLPSLRYFQCQQDSCPSPSIHRTFTISDFHCIQTHVTTEHSFSPSSSSPSQIILRWCPLCSKSFPCNSFKTERLFTAHLHSCYGNKHKTIICSICGKPCLYVDHLMHFWSHKNTQDKIKSIKEGSPIPSQWRRRVLSRKGRARQRDPFYSLISGQGEAQPKTEEKSIKTKDPPRKQKFRKNTPESLAQRTCPTCQKVFKYLHHLRHHMRSHLSQDSRQYFECPHCSKKLSSATTLRNHLERVHRGQDSGVSKDVMIQCSMCPQQFYHRDTTIYKAHMKMHEGGDTPYICDKCGKGFWWKRYLEKHREMHKDNDDDRVECDKCGKSFKQRKYLLRHLRKAH